MPIPVNKEPLRNSNLIIRAAGELIRRFNDLLPDQKRAEGKHARDKVMKTPPYKAS